MKTIQITPGRFNHFDLARQLHSKHIFKEIYTTYPTWKLKQQGELDALPGDSVKTFPWFGVPYMAISRYKSYHVLSSLINELFWQTINRLDLFASRHISDFDVLIAQSGCGFHSGSIAKKNGLKYICDKPSSHVLYENQIVSDEFFMRGKKFIGADIRWIEKELNEYELADLIVVPSDFAFNTFIDNGIPKSKLRKAVFGVEISRFYKNYKPSEDYFDILFVGTVSFLKGIPYLLDAFAKLGIKNKRLKIVGSISSEMKDYFISNPPSSNIFFLGNIPHIEVKNIMSSSHVMVLPSLSDGFGLVVAEAMACGCPVIVSENTVGNDLVTNGKDGFVIKTRSSEEILNCFQILSEDSHLRNEMGFFAEEKMRKINGWDNYGYDFINILNEFKFKPS